jgi:hypothetical protein
MATKCKTCQGYLRDCDCDNPKPVCSNCENPLSECECEGTLTPERCKRCKRWNAYEYYQGGTAPNGEFFMGVFMCGRCLKEIIKNMPEMNVHVDGTPDVPDIVRPGDWLALEDYDGFESFVLVVKVFKTNEDEWDYCPGAESWSIQYLGTGYLRKEEKLSSHDCGCINGIVAVNGELLKLYKLGYNEEEKRHVVPNPGHTVTRSAGSLIRRMNTVEKNDIIHTLQLSLF